MRGFISPLFTENNRVSVKRELLFFAVLAIAFYFLAPRFWEPGAESWKNWVSAQILRNTGYFTVLHHGALYNIYLQVFLSFPYPLSFQLEHIITCFFASWAIFFCLRRHLPIQLAILLVCAWIPVLWVVEGGARIAGIGFFALYLGGNRNNHFNAGFLPIPLVAAAMCDVTFIAFLLGNAIGIGVEKRYTASDISKKKPGKFSIALWVRVGLGLLALAAITLQSDREDNNVNAHKAPWSPIPQGEILTASYVQIGSSKYVSRNFPKEEWIYQDWYLIHEEVYGDAKTLYEAIMNNPNAFISHIRENIMWGGSRLPLVLLIGHFGARQFSGVAVAGIACILLSIGLAQYFTILIKKNEFARFGAIFFGTLATGTALMLTHPTMRYSIVLMPIGLMGLAYIGEGIRGIFKVLSSLISRTVQVGESRSVGEFVISTAGSGLIALGILVNELTVSLLFSTDGSLETLTRASLWIIDIILISIGLLLIWKRREITYLLKQHFDNSIVGIEWWPDRLFISLLAVLTLYFNFNPTGQGEDWKTLIGTEFLLSHAGTVSTAFAADDLFATVNHGDRILALEEPWIKAFADIDLDRVHHALELPPFEDISGETEDFLESFDVIWVSENMSRKEPSMGTQIYLRYMLHIQPFLEKRLGVDWEEQYIENFGKVYTQK
jgi:hypothetical protein